MGEGEEGKLDEDGTPVDAENYVIRQLQRQEAERKLDALRDINVSREANRIDFFSEAWQNEKAARVKALFTAADSWRSECVTLQKELAKTPKQNLAGT